MHFYKFDGTSNDFVVFDNRKGDIDLSSEKIASLCDRRSGVGADGLILLQMGGDTFDFEMRFFNSDGRSASMCGNGGRCIVLFAHILGITPRFSKDSFHFLAPDGPHDASVLDWNPETGRGLVRLSMRSVCLDTLRSFRDDDGGEGVFLDTGSPHFVKHVLDLEHYDVVSEGRRIRNRADLFPDGTNVDFIELHPDGSLFVRTYERGVEDETRSCGTGVTACSLVTGRRHIVTRGGSLEVDFSRSELAFEHITLTGPASLNFTGDFV